MCFTCSGKTMCVCGCVHVLKDCSKVSVYLLQVPVECVLLWTIEGCVCVCVVGVGEGGSDRADCSSAISSDR